VGLAAGSNERTCRVIRQGTEDGGQYGASYVFGVTAETVGARGLSMALATVPPGARTKAHVHEHHESAIYVISGRGELYFGEQLENREAVQAGDFLYMPEGSPHVAVNTSPTEPLVVIGARTDPHIQEVVLPRPDLDARVP
jgi:uncharacterized RmlC-like cupin family protein